MSQDMMRKAIRNSKSLKNKADRAMTDEALQWMRDYRKARVANRQLPCQPKSA